VKVALVHGYYSSRKPCDENLGVHSQFAAPRHHGINVRIAAAQTNDLEGRSGYNVRSALKVATGAGLSPVPLDPHESPTQTRCRV
jgi:hypothetical protein